MVIKTDIFPVVLTWMKDKDEYVKKNDSTLIGETAKYILDVKKRSFNYNNIC